MSFLPLFLLSLMVAASPRLATAADEDGRWTNFSIPDRPEGITNGPGSIVFVSQILSGKVLSMDVLTGETKEVLGEQSGRQAWGLWHYKDALLVAGGGPPYGDGAPELYVYSVSSGDLLATCSPVSSGPFGSFLNDVIVIENTAYATDSFHGKLMKILDVDQVIATGSCNNNTSVTEIDLPENFDPENDADWSPNGLVEYAGGLLVVHETDGSVWHIRNLDDAPVFQQVLADGQATFGDGLNILDDRLYVTRNFADVISVFQLMTTSTTDDNNITATFLGNITSPMYATPATSALWDGYIYSTNARFAALEDIAAPAENNVVGVKDPFAGTTATSSNHSSEEEGSTSNSGAHSTIAACSNMLVLLLLFSLFV